MLKKVYNVNKNNIILLWHSSFHDTDHAAMTKKNSKTTLCKNSKITCWTGVIKFSILFFIGLLWFQKSGCWLLFNLTWNNNQFCGCWSFCQWTENPQSVSFEDTKQFRSSIFAETDLGIQTLVETNQLIMLWTLLFTDRFLTKEVDGQIRYFNEYSVKPYYRIAPYLVGIACADIYMKTKDHVNTMKENWWKVWANCIRLSLPRHIKVYIISKCIEVYEGFRISVSGCFLFTGFVVNDWIIALAWAV